MDVAALASFLSPLMPTLLRAGRPRVDSLAEVVGTAAGVEADRIWERLGPRLAQCPAGEEATRKVAHLPDDVRWRTALELQLGELFAREPQLAGEVDDLLARASAMAASRDGARRRRGRGPDGRPPCPGRRRDGRRRHPRRARRARDTRARRSTRPTTTRR